MHSRLFTVAALFASGSLAAQNWLRLDAETAHAIRGLRIRQSDESFLPGTTPGYGDDCADAFGAGHLECADSGVCYNPDEGQLCCDEGYPCPSGSFCLGAGKCCPEGLDPQTCADQLGIELPSNAPSTGPAPAPTEAPAPTSAPVLPPAPTSAVPAPPVIVTESCAPVPVLTTTITKTVCPSSVPVVPVPTNSVPTVPQPTVSVPAVPVPTSSVPTVPVPEFPTGTSGYPTSTGVPTGPVPPPFDSGASVKTVATGSVAIAALIALLF